MDNYYKQMPQTSIPPTEIPLPNVKNTNINGQSYTILKSETKGDIAVENIGVFNTKEELLRTFNELQKDPLEREKFNSLPKDKQEQYLINLVVNKYKITHELTNTSKQEKQNPNLVNSATINVAKNKENDVKVNSEIGIVKDDINGTITTIEQNEDNTIKITETDSIGNNELINPTEEQYNDIYQTENYQNITTPQEEQNINSLNPSDAYLSENGIENPTPKFTENLTPEMILGTPPAMTNKHTRRRVLQPNRMNRPGGFITTKMMATIIISFPLALLIGLIIGTILKYS